MPAKKNSLPKITQVLHLRLRLEAGISIFQISASHKIHVGVIQKLLSRADTLGLASPLPKDLADGHVLSTSSSCYQAPGWATV
jgi:hypothetical protein